MLNTKLADLGWLIIRVTCGLSLALLHGYGKVFKHGLVGLTESVRNMGFPAPTFFAWCAGLTEFFGGLLLAAGFLTRPASLFLSVTMLVALYSHRGDELVKMEKALVYLAFGVGAFLIGGGKLSLDSVLRPRFPVSWRRTDYP
jgi:putative oxidoreductase